jgi:Zn-dependent protease
MDGTSFAVSTTTPELIRNCRRCSQELAPGALVCDQCLSLVHSEELERLAAEAKALEANGELQRAREQWLTGLQLLPPASKQAEWIKQHAAGLSESDPVRSQRRPPAGSWVQRARPRSFLKLTFLLSFAVFVGVYWSASGARFGIGFAILILIHEMGHYIDIRRRGLPADMPIFLPGLGAYVRWRALGVSLETRAAISLAGPFAGFLAALACAVLWWQTGNPLWASLARVGAALNLLNLIPVWMLDGGQAALALAKGERIVLLAACVAIWLLVRENMLLLVALGAAYRAFFSRDLPAHPSRVTTAYFVAVLTALGGILWLMPGQGFGAN